MTTPDMSHVHQDISDQKRLVLCFDGTGNKFLGDESDTNIVKLYQMLDRACPNQYHYYQRLWNLVIRMMQDPID